MCVCLGEFSSMSSVKRSNLTASEHGQSKAPDKWEPPSKTSANALAANPSDTCETMSSTSAKSQTQQQSRDAQKSVNSTQEVTKVQCKTTQNINQNYVGEGKENVSNLSTRTTNRMGSLKLNQMYAKNDRVNFRKKFIEMKS